MSRVVVPYTVKRFISIIGIKEVKIGMKFKSFFFIYMREYYCYQNKPEFV
jgi:hypothetical protein